jgi:hypothetical protein
MEMRDRILGPIRNQPDGESSTIRVDYGDFVRKLLLSEQFILEAGLLEDFPLLLAKFGYDGMAELLKSGRLRVLADFFICAQTGQTEILDARREKGILPLGSYALSAVALHDLKEHTHKGMAAINATPGLTAKQSKRTIHEQTSVPLVVGASQGVRTLRLRRRGSPLWPVTIAALAPATARGALTPMLTGTPRTITTP